MRVGRSGVLVQRNWVAVLIAWLVVVAMGVLWYLTFIVDLPRRQHGLVGLAFWAIVAASGVRGFMALRAEKAQGTESASEPAEGVSGDANRLPARPDTT